MKVTPLDKKVTLSVSIPASLKERIQSEAQAKGMTIAEYIDYIFEFSQLELLDRLIYEIKQKNKRLEFTNAHLAQLSMLKNYIELII